MTKLEDIVCSIISFWFVIITLTYIDIINPFDIFGYVIEGEEVRHIFILGITYTYGCIITYNRLK